MAESGIERSDRKRLRTRLRVGSTLRVSENAVFGARIRSGSNRSHQSPHVTVADFDGNGTDSFAFGFDKWFFSWSGDRFEVSLGRNSLPLWKQSELIWDDDVTVLGIGSSLSTEKFEINLGIFKLPVGLQSYSGTLRLGQLVHRSGSEDGREQLVWGVGLLQIRAEPGEADALRLLDGNGSRDYTLITAGAQYSFELTGFGLRLGTELYRNLKDYGPMPIDEFTRNHADEKSGFAIYAGIGRPESNSWDISLTYASVDAFAVNSSYAQDDWLRWGTATESRGSNFAGYEVRVRYSILQNANLQLRYDEVDALELRSPSSIAKEDGQRFRLDLNFSF